LILLKQTLKIKKIIRSIIKEYRKIFQESKEEDLEIKKSAFGSIEERKRRESVFLLSSNAPSTGCKRPVKKDPSDISPAM
jgi:hypothetical protein